MNDLITEQIEKKSVKKDVNKLSRTLIYCQLILTIIYFFSILFLYIKNSSSIDAITEKYEGIIYIVSVAAGSLCFLHYYKYNSIEDISTVTKKLSIKNIMICTAIILALQLISQLSIYTIENSLNLFGYSLMNSLEQVSAPAVTISMFLYASLVGPVIEEFIFRGIIIKKLEKYGKMFAILISSVMFGFYHSNAYQGIIVFR
ncbi:MAG: CPBP family intramembrane metalloprotease [Eubacteriaceae bacterium]|nr:CPBP family intramembrane metalloprotease [Eubacteriaceae bacterium]